LNCPFSVCELPPKADKVRPERLQGSKKMKDAAGADRKVLKRIYRQDMKDKAQRSA
jgi:hypothetical protein